MAATKDRRLLVTFQKYLREGKPLPSPAGRRLDKHNLTFTLGGGRALQLPLRRFFYLGGRIHRVSQGLARVPGRVNSLLKTLSLYADHSGEVAPEDEAFLREYG